MKMAQPTSDPNGKIGNGKMATPTGARKMGGNVITSAAGPKIDTNAKMAQPTIELKW